MGKLEPVFCFHLNDGTLLLSRELAEDLYTHTITGAFVLTKVRTPGSATVAGIDPVKVVLTKYDNFNNDSSNEITLQKTGIISSYVVDDKVKELYEGFLADQIEQLAKMDGPVRGASPSITDMLQQLLTENEEKDNVVNLNEIRKKTIRLDDDKED